MLILEKKATTTRQSTPYLEYEACIIENLGENRVYVQTSFLELKGQLIDDGAVVDSIEAYGYAQYSNVKTKKRRFFGLGEKVTSEIGMVMFWAESGESDIRIKAFNGAASKQRQWAGLKTKAIKGEDNTEVGTTSANYLLVKTLNIQNISESEAVFQIYTSLKASADVGWLKVTSEVDGGGEEEEDEYSSSSASYEYRTTSISVPIFGSLLTLKVYIKNPTGSSTYTEILKGYGYDISEVTF